MSHLKNIISYWRDSLVDAERMGLDGQAFNNPEDYFRVSRFEISTGRINQDITHKIFNKSKTEDNSKLAGENKQTPLIKRQRPAIDTLPESTDDAQKTSSSDSDEKISILLCPMRAVSLTNTVRKDSVAPLWIPAKINRFGELFCDSENAPWLSRKLLEPTEFTKHTIGTLTDFNNFLLEYDRPTQNWDDFWLYCLKMLKQVTQMDCDNFTLEGYASQKEGFIFINSTIQGGSRHILKVYDWLLERKHICPALLERYSSEQDAPIEPLLTQRQQTVIPIMHLGHMTEKHPLSRSQREALYHFFNIKDGEILAVNGPPGTGKTTLLQSVVASFWVAQAVLGQNPPIILAASTNNQAVTNIIDSFGKTDQADGSVLSRRWLPDVVSYGLYLPSKGKLTNFQTADPDGIGFPSEKEKREYVIEAERYFLEHCRIFAGGTFDNVTQAVDFLHRELLQLAIYLKKNIGYSLMELEASYLLDTEVRYKAFKLATHYWEGRWLVSMQQLLRKRSADSKAQTESLIDRYSRYAMLTPCFVSTFYMAPKFFSYYDYENKSSVPAINLIDLLIVDEAGQVSPEVAGATFALAKKALVVGDMLQIEPVWSIPSAIDKGNLQKYNLLPKKYDVLTKPNPQQEIDLKGLTASAGCVMRIAQRASRYQKFAGQRGMFLSEHRRCLQEIISYCNELCYQGQLQPMRKVSAKSLFPAMGYLHISGQSRRISSSHQNELEAQTIAQWLSEQHQKIENFYQGKKLEDILAVVTPFSKQAELIQKELIKKGISNITVGTVHRLQGAEREIIIFSPVYDLNFRGTFFFDRTVNMLNVAVSRAKDSFLVFGNRQLFNVSNKETPSGLLAKYLFRSDSNQLPSLSSSLHNKNVELKNLPIKKTKNQPPPPPIKKKQVQPVVISAPPFYLDVPFEQNDDAKRLGASFDWGKKLWFVPPGYDTLPFKKWFPRKAEDVKFYIFTSDELIAAWTKAYGQPSSLEKSRLRANALFLAFTDNSVHKAINIVYQYFKINSYEEDEDIGDEPECKVQIMQFGVEEVLRAYKQLFYSDPPTNIPYKEQKYIINNYLDWCIFDNAYETEFYHEYYSFEQYVAFRLNEDYSDHD